MVGATEVGHTQRVAIESALVLAPVIFVVAALYASVGHGGASGYLAVLGVFSFAPAEMATTALILNLLVAGPAFWQFRRAGHFPRGLLSRFLVASIPAAFVGGMVALPAWLYALVLAAVLAFAAIRLAYPVSAQEQEVARRPGLVASLPAGGGIGFVSGMVGVGGGIFLSPLLLLMRWATAKETAAVSAAFIVFGSLSGLAGRMAGGTAELGGLLALIPAAAAGGFAGSHAGAWRFSSPALRRLLAVVLLLAAAKMVHGAL